MVEPRTRRVVALVGVLLILVSLPLFWTSCTDVGYEGDPPGGFEFRGFTGFTVTYSPDGGANTCTAGTGPVFLPLGVALVALALVR